MILYILFAWGVRRKENTRVDPQRVKQARANRLARKYLSSARNSLGDKTAFYNALERALHNYLRAKLTIETQDFSKDKIVQLLQARVEHQEVIATFIAVLSQCEAARYAPSSEVSMQADFDQAVQAITALDREL